MKRIRASLSVLFTLLVSLAVNGQERQRQVDAPEDQEDLNRELWEFAKHTPYDSIT